LKSQATITDLENAEKQSKKQAAVTDLNAFIAKALHWYYNGNTESGRFPKKFTKRCAEAVITLVFNEKVATSMKRADMIAFIKSQLDQKPTAIHDATVKHPFTVTEKPPKLPRDKAPPTEEEEEESSEESCNYSLHDEESNNPFSRDSSRSNHSEYPSPAAPPTAARSMSGYLYRWSLQASSDSARALEMALVVFSVVQEIRQNDVDSVIGSLC
jgi:hypothetical protein